MAPKAGPPRSAQAPENRARPELHDGSVAYLDLWGSGRRERDNLPWHLRRGASLEGAPTTYGLPCLAAAAGVAFTAPSDANGLAKLTPLP